MCPSLLCRKIFGAILLEEYGISKILFGKIRFVRILFAETQFTAAAIIELIAMIGVFL